MARALVLRSWHPLKWALHATNATVTSPRLYRTFTNPIALAVMQWQQPRTIARTALSRGSCLFLGHGFYVVSSLTQKLTKLPFAPNKKYKTV